MAAEDIVNLAQRRSVFFPSAEIYSSAPAGFFDFGSVGNAMRRKIVDFWRKELVEKEGFEEICGSQVLPKEVFVASGHLQNFADPIVLCNKCQSVFRVDSLVSLAVGEPVAESLSPKEFDELIKKHRVKCTKCKSMDFAPVQKFNMMMEVSVGATGKDVAYLRPETCQSIFLDFARIFKTARKSLPLGIAQAGNSFRNEIAPRNALIREREIGQMEIEVFFNPKKINEIVGFEDVKDYKLNLFLLKSKRIEKISCADAVSKKIVSGKLIAYHLARTQQFFEKLGIPIEKIRFRELEKEARAFYAKETWDFEVETSLGWVELVACNYRSDVDLTAHQKQSRTDLSIKEEGDAQPFVPHVFELSAGLDRALFVLLDLAFRKEKRGPEERVFLDLHPRIAPFFVSVFPLVKKDGLFESGKEIFEELNNGVFEVFFDEKGSIGKRYARVDEIGVPFAITIDYDTMKDSTVTIRERNSLAQKRVKVSELFDVLLKMFLGKMSFEKI
ncbi:MAG: glycine--tRNA ligase [Candidatus Diapherotrites archaeon]|nr:glycine--tRNA ligase [Candidatus Diapherotrites archaeon]